MMEKGIIKFSLFVLSSLAILALSNIHIASTKERHLIAWEKAAIDSIQNIDSLKLKAKMSLDHLLSEQKAHSNKALALFCALVPVCYF